MTWRDDVLATWETERLKTLQVWQSFRDDDLAWRPTDAQQRGRSVHEQMVHQCVSEDRWCNNMLGIDLGISALPTTENRTSFIEIYSTASAK